MSPTHCTVVRLTKFYWYLHWLLLDQNWKFNFPDSNSNMFRIFACPSVLFHSPVLLLRGMNIVCINCCVLLYYSRVQQYSVCKRTNRFEIKVRWSGSFCRNLHSKKVLPSTCTGRGFDTYLHSTMTVNQWNRVRYVQINNDWLWQFRCHHWIDST